MAEFDLIQFDLDGTLIDSVPQLAQAVNRMRVQLGFGEAGEQAVRHWVRRWPSIIACGSPVLPSSSRYSPITAGLASALLSGETVTILTPTWPPSDVPARSKSLHAGISSSVESAPSGRVIVW